MPKGETMRQVMRQDELEDLVGLVSQSFLGLTVNCARCHDHKFDPIRQTDYYRLAAALAGVKRGNRDLPVRPPAELVARHAAAEKELKESAGAAREAELKAEVARLAAELDAHRKTYAVTPQAAPVMHRLVRGNVEQPAEAIAAGGIACLTASGPDFGLSPEAGDTRPPREAGRVDRQRAEPALRPDDRQPALAAPLWPRAGRDAERPGLQRRPAVASGAARFAGRRADRPAAGA